MKPEGAYAEVPLSPNKSTEMHLSYENGGYQENSTLIWEPTNLLTARDMVVRVGDALLFTCAPESSAASPATSGAARIEVDGQLVHAGNASQSVAHRFERAGTFVVDAVRVGGFRLSSGTDTDFEIIDRYDDGTDLIEMGLVLSPVPPQVAVEIKLIVGGVVFEDGTGLKRWTAADFNPLGEAVVRFLRPAVAKTSVCHTITALQGSVRLDDGL